MTCFRCCKYEAKNRLEVETKYGSECYDLCDNCIDNLHDWLDNVTYDEDLDVVFTYPEDAVKLNVTKVSKYKMNIEDD